MEPLGIRTPEEVEAAEARRMERKVPKPLVPDVSLRIKADLFRVKLVGLPGPVRLIDRHVGNVVFESSDAGDVNAEIEVAAQSSSGNLSLTLQLPTMEFEQKLNYSLMRGRNVTLQFTEEGLLNSQKTDL